MPSVILTDAKLYVAQFNVSGDLNTIKLITGADLKESTAFGATYRTFQGGGALMKTELAGAGYVQSGASAVETALHGNLGVDSVPITVAAEGGDVGEPCRFFKGVADVYDPALQIGDLYKFNVSAKSSGLSGNNPLVRGTIMEDGKTSRTTASNTATQTLGAVSATQKLYAALHLIAFNGTDITFVVKSAVTDFGTISTRGTFTQNTAVGSEYLTPVAGATTDTFWRIYYTGTFTSFSAVIVLGIQ